MYFAVLRNSENRELPPALLRAETAQGIRDGMNEYCVSGWECVFLVEGDEIDRPTFFHEEKEVHYDN